MTIRKTKYVAASDINEAWLRFRAGLYTEDREDSLIRADEKTADDKCEPPCKFTVYEVHVDIHVDDGPETECQDSPDWVDQRDEWGYGPDGEFVDLR